MATRRMRYYSGGLNLAYRAVAAAEYVDATLKAAFRTAAGNDADPVVLMYKAFRGLHDCAPLIHARYKDEFPAWLKEDRKMHGPTGPDAARVVCMTMAEHALEERGLLVRPRPKAPDARGMVL